MDQYFDKFPPDCLNCASFRLETHFKCITAALSMLCVGFVRFGSIRIGSLSCWLSARRSLCVCGLVDFGRRLFEGKFCIDMKNVQIRQWIFQRHNWSWVRRNGCYVLCVRVFSMLQCVDDYGKHIESNSVGPYMNRISMCIHKHRYYNGSFF